MDHKTKIRYHFDNHGPVIVSINELEHSQPILNVIYSGNGGAIKGRCLCSPYKDKEGKDIFEFDIIEFIRENGDTIQTTVSFDGSFRIFPNKTIHLGNEAFWRYSKSIKVIGNGYENSDLFSKLCAMS